jgi:hypothetical protein
MLRILCDASGSGIGNYGDYCKEISEAMAMVDATQRVLHMYNTQRSVASLASKQQLQQQHKTATNKSVAEGVEEGNLEQAAGEETVAPEEKKKGGDEEVVVYVLGDGKRPLCAAALALHLPAHFKYYSIDPIMDPTYCSIPDASAGPDSWPAPRFTPSPKLGSYGDRMFPIAAYSQDFVVPAPAPAPAAAPTPTPAPTGACLSTLGPLHSASIGIDETVRASSISTGSRLSIVVSCHSHAPLQEFWDRVQAPKLAITMACCAGFAELCCSVADTKAPSSSSTPSTVAAGDTTGVDGGIEKAIPTMPLQPALEFDDFEVYSPKRHIKLYIESQ